MFGAAHQKGVADALTRFGLKEANFVVNAGKTIGRMMVGHPDVIMREGRKTFSPGGFLHWKNVLWPTFDKHPIMSWIGRAGTIMPAFGAIQALRGKGDPNEGRLSNALGALGGMAAGSYGFMAGGMLGGPMVGNLGEHLGRGVGHMLGSRPTPPDVAPPSLRDQLASRYLPFGQGQ